MNPDTVHDSVLVFSKTWGAAYLLAVFLLAALWIYWPSRKATYDEAALSPLGDEEIIR
ncbi:CcoQ/FixQ family Cbb3-type cytochrome c oxidase assembly chaperone (plasmid) [Parasedimentitalea marina]|uniref:CcoQ/FixQ family Cbb3-type cytochrome c oxidase assembly chaperone n=1 Tax=Parasedimentitalea marina TaxID=2483033 RepID=A0A3T0N9X4_9RHOB|nr:CcoQ/FixQ family Cbb3-type cytochrome c oxidase assembly chaperone [Parasedimentitalea marina]AZV80828.1 CcoQ/FixQ family Cbb3-type cytochrome c oxidase assembly chaperone [Parasedimentitalea marina]